jgi:hypothetical protein
MAGLGNRAARLERGVPGMIPGADRIVNRLFARLHTPRIPKNRLPEVYEDLVNRLNSWSRATRESAEKQLATLSPIGLAQAAPTAIHGQRMSAWRFRRCMQFLVCPMLGMLISGWVWNIEVLANHGTMIAMPLALGNISFSVPSRASRAVARACKQVQGEDSLQVALALLESWAGRDVNRTMPTTSADMTFQKDACEAIRSGLDRIASKEAQSLTISQQSAIVWLLYSPLAEPELTVAALRVVEYFGGRDELPVVEKLTSVRTSNPERRSLVTAAEVCLDALRLRLEQRRNHDTLLRPATGDKSDRLLRPADYAATTESQLVRPVDAS